MSEKVYLGDGVYAEWVGEMVCLSTERVLATTTHTIYLEPEVYAALEAFVLRGPRR